MMRLAIKESEKSHARFKLGCVVAKGKKVIGRGYNSYHTHPRGSGKYQTRHAEVAAIMDAKRAGHDLSSASIYIYRRGNNLAKPCSDCQKLIDEVGIKKVYYSGYRYH